MEKNEQLIGETLLDDLSKIKTKLEENHES
jgi:hypothetical protein